MRKMKNFGLNAFKTMGLVVLALIFAFSLFNYSTTLGQTDSSGRAVNLLGVAGNALNNFYPAVPFNLGDFLLIIIGVRNFILFLGIVLGVIFIVLGGINYMRSGGDEAKRTTARDQIIGGIIGLAVAVAVFLIMNFVIDFVRTRSGLSALT